MARNTETTPINPRTIVNALNEYLADVNYLKSVVDNAYRFLTDDALDAAKVRKVVAPQLKEASDRMSKWYDAE